MKAKRKPQRRLLPAERTARNESIVEHHLAGTPMKALAQKYNLSVNSISQILRNADVVARDKSARNRSVWEGHRAGMSRAELAERHGITEGLVYQILRNAGIRTRDGLADRDREVVTGYERGASIDDLADRHGLSRDRIEQILHHEDVQMRIRYPDLSGQTFHHLTVLEPADVLQGDRRWLCRCVCGNESVVTTHNLTHGRTRSCGCVTRSLKHGHARRGKITPEYRMLKNAKTRATVQGVPFSLTLDDIIIPKTCPALGVLLTVNEARLGDDSPSLDRLVPELGYVPGNVQVLSHRANRIKQDASAEELEKVAVRMRIPIPEPVEDAQIPKPIEADPIDGAAPTGGPKEPAPLSSYCGAKADRDADIIGRYREGRSVKEVALRHGMSGPGIAKILRRHGVHLRDRHPDLTGLGFGRLAVIGRAGSKDGRRLWLCRCACGNETAIRTADLRAGNTKSCGCLSGRTITHGQARRGQMTPEYLMFKAAKVRANKAAVPFTITLDDIVIPETCPMLGMPLVRNTIKPADDSPSLDRRVPASGYVPGNVQVLSHRANRIKQDATAEELEKVARWMRRSTRLRIVP